MNILTEEVYNTWNVTKSFPAIVYNRRKGKSERVDVVWSYVYAENKAGILSLLTRNGDIKKWVPQYQLRNLMDQVNHKAMLLTTEQRMEMMWGSYAL